MSTNVITPLLEGLGIPTRLLNIVSWYLTSLILSTDKHSQKFAEKVSGKASSLFSKLLKKHLKLSTVVLNRAARRQLVKLAKVRIPVVKTGPWTIAIIIDSTLHERSSRHSENVQKFNHGKGWVLGHQWTNIGILINGQYVPLPPMPFYTKNECKKRGINYKTEHDKLTAYLKTLPLKHLLGDHISSEVVVIMDSGYDTKKLQKVILSRKWDFVSAVKKGRQISKEYKEWASIHTYFSDGRRPSKAFRLRSDSGKGKWRKYATKQLEGRLKGIKTTVKLVCSKRSDGKIKFLVCSNVSVDIKTILSIYQKRWTIEIFHRAVKSYLGLEDAGVTRFNSLHAHVHWVYCAYILLNCQVPNPDKGIKEKQQLFEVENDTRKLNVIIKKSCQVNGKKHVKIHCLSLIKEMRRAYVTL